MSLLVSTSMNPGNLTQQRERAHRTVQNRHVQVPFGLFQWNPKDSDKASVDMYTENFELGAPLNTDVHVIQVQFPVVDTAHLCIWHEYQDTRTPGRY